MAAALASAEAKGDGAAMLHVDQLAPLLLSYQGRLMRLADDVDASWLRRMEREEGLPAIAATDSLARRSAAVRARLRLPVVAPDSFTPPAHRLAALDKPSLLLVLAVRALFAHRVALSLCVDGAVLARLRTLVGAPALSALRAAGCADAADGPPCAPLPAHPDLTAWAIEGYCHFERDAVWRNPSLRRLVELALPATATASAERTEAAATNDSDALLALLPTLFPELTWLFG
ncbi:type III secretion system HrpB4-like protein [Duganella sp. 1411]|uniref:type III secretion protein HrpB4 n=1 Tax=Duganella sp. 1411 TaxID=2806572 RepID=UPI001AE1EC15|nr:type III secretion protein HrpB4 [Duganella sp. 1411]MBP1204799.1 type III secretion system HrpB4-like protein [Duganella sp. 1411]